ncbi:hypothetical protein ABEF93_000332 [Exophiala dermatitidis]
MAGLPSPLLEEQSQSGWFASDRSAKARFKAFFTRSKSERTVPQSTTRVVSDRQVESRPCPPSTLNVAKRGRSTTWSNRQRDSQQSVKPQRSRNMTSWDPPPLVQAYTQVKMHAILDIPSTLTTVLVRGHQRRNSISGDSPRSSMDNQASPTVDTGLKHRRNCSGTSVCSLTQKLFILTRSGHILQYSADGFNDRLPEKILELGSDSVAFACDDVRGKHWVLRVSQDRGPTQLPSHNSKHSWSKFSFKNQENKNLVKDLLLVFDDAITLGLWLTAVRKEIELMGGLQYRPDSRGPGEEDQEVEPRRPLRTRRSLPIFSRSSSTITKVTDTEPASPVLLPPMPQRISSRKISRSTTDSSINTLTDLDQIREPSFSDDRSVSTAHTSFTGSTTSMSNVIESFSSMESYEAPTTKDAQSRVSTPTQEDAGELSMMMATPKRRPPPSDSISHDLLVPTSDADHQAAVSWESKSRPISTIAPLPEPGHIRKISARYRCELQGLPVQPMTPTSRPGSLRSRSSSYASESPDGVQRRTPSYSLFPKTPSHDQPQLINTGLPSPPVTTPGSALESMCGTGPGLEAVGEEKESISKSRPSSRGSQHASRRLGKALSIDTKHAEAGSKQISLPQRSPAVTDAMLQTCFGAHTDAPRRPSTNGCLSTITTTTIETHPAVSSPVLQLANPPRKQRHVRGRKSMPSLAHRSLPPCGPPPNVPLPALPTEACLPLPEKLASMSCTRPQRPTLKHSKTESAGASLGSNKFVSLDNAPRPAMTHKKNMSSVSSVASVRQVTVWLQSDRVASFAAKREEAPTLNISVPDSPAFSCGFEKLMS